MRAVLVFVAVALAATMAAGLLLLAGSARAQAPMYKTSVGCYTHGVANPGGLEQGTTNVLNEQASGGWEFVPPAVIYDVGRGFCVLMIFRRTQR